MTYAKRFDKRKFNETRQITAEAGVIPRADGSARFQIGRTIAYAAVYGPRELHPRFMQNPKKGLLRCTYSMMPFSGSGERIRPGPNRRAKEISMVTKNALIPAVDLADYPNKVVDVFIEFPQTDAGSRCAGICAASIALADAGVPMKTMIPAIAVGKVDDKVVVDLEYAEEAYENGPVADVPIAMIPGTDELTLLQMDGDITREELKKALEMGKEALKEIFEIQKQAVKKKYEGELQ